jgi:hypothetical protein
MTADPFPAPKESLRAYTVSQLWKAQHGVDVAVRELQNLNKLAAAQPLLHRALLPLLSEVAALSGTIIALRNDVEQS